MFFIHIFSHFASGMSYILQWDCGGSVQPCPSFCSPLLGTLCLEETQMPLEDPGGKNPKLVSFRGQYQYNLLPAWLELCVCLFFLSLLTSRKCEATSPHLSTTNAFSPGQYWDEKQFFTPISLPKKFAKMLRSLQRLGSLTFSFPYSEWGSYLAVCSLIQKSREVTSSSMQMMNVIVCDFEDEYAVSNVLNWLHVITCVKALGNYSSFYLFPQ